MFEEAVKIVNDSKSIYVVAHVNPDGDAIGSTFATYFALKKLGKEVYVVMPSYSSRFEFLPGVKDSIDKIEKKNYDLLIALDSSDYTRLAVSEEEYKNAKKVIMIDHHKISRPYGDFRYIDDKKASASEIAYLFIKALGVEIDKDIATMLYAGIMSDTGCFSYADTSPDTLRIAAELMEKGVNFVEICQRLNDTMKEEKLKLIAKAVDNMETYMDGKIRYTYISYEDIVKLGLNDEESEGMANYLRAVDGTEVAIYVRGKSDGTLKVSMRSRGNIDLSKIAIAFGGGGHPQAAGYTMNGDIEVEKDKLIKVVGEML